MKNEQEITIADESGDRYKYGFVTDIDSEGNNFCFSSDEPESQDDCCRQEKTADKDGEHQRHQQGGTDPEQLPEGDGIQFGKKTVPGIGGLFGFLFREPGLDIDQFDPDAFQFFEIIGQLQLEIR